MSKVKETLKEDLTNDEIKQVIENVEETEGNIEQESKTDIEKNQEINKKDNITILEQNEVNSEDKEKEQTNETNKKVKGDFLHKYTIAITIISVLLFVGLVLFSTVFALINRNSDKIVNGVYINGIEVSGLNIEEAKEKLMRNMSKQIKPKHYIESK